MECKKISKKCAVPILLAVALMTVITLSIVISKNSSRNISTNFKHNQKNKDLELKCVHILFRHGVRSPVTTYPTDPHVNETFRPYGRGQLTNKGRLGMYDVGRFLKERYESFLGNNILQEEVHAQSTGADRAKMSLQLVLAGMFPPQGTILEWNKDLNWVPFPYSYQELDEDTLLLVRKPCPRYHEELKRVFEHDVKKELEDYAKMMEELSILTNDTIKSPDDVQSLYSTLQAEKEFGLPLPPWAEKYFPEQMQLMTDKSYIYNAYNNELKKLKGGVFVDKAIKDWEMFEKNNKTPRRIFLFGGHDATVTNILAAFNVWNAESGFPDYGITAMLELSKHKITNGYGVEIFLRNSTDHNPYQLTIPGCSTFCPLSKLEELLKDNIPKNWEDECKPKDKDFKEPSLSEV